MRGSRVESPAALARLIPVEFGRAHRLVPLEETEDWLRIAAAPPIDPDVLGRLAALTRRSIEAAEVTLEEIEAAQARLWGPWN